jgi:hypothetical protein
MPLSKSWSPTAAWCTAQAFSYLSLIGAAVQLNAVLDQSQSNGSHQR